ncbi:MAG TPA: hypothetical protein VGX03_23440, partial [Candidatus Binatia bacterium]|nr:hypothetical protein [Candidatus Binatia bacterium]
SLKTFLILMRNLIRLHGKTGLLTYEKVLDQFERHFQQAFPRLRQLIAIRAGQQQWSGTPLTDFFRDYLAEVQQIVAVIDLLPSPTSHPHG